jgi:hypothetical protein
MTAVREGARYAATDSRLASATPATVTAAQSDIKDRVQAVVASATNIAIPDADITVSGPTGTFGSRTVTVTVDYDYTSSITPVALMSSYSGDTVGADTLDGSNINISTVMRYEE